MRDGISLERAFAPKPFVWTASASGKREPSGFTAKAGLGSR
jgi:hypothetical protein